MFRNIGPQLYLRELVFAAMGCVLFASVSTAQSSATVIRKDNNSATADADATAGELFLAFRMEEWRAAHFHDAEKAAKHAEILKQLGCEVKTADHNGHIDVQCKTTFWKSLALNEQDKVDQWQKWFDAFGFDTIHGRPLGTARANAEAEGEKKPAVLETVEFRCPEWKTIHPAEDVELAQTLALYRSLGCEVMQEKHEGHVDVRLRAPEWREVALPTHEAAHKWQTFLQQAGFETKHSH